jgi:ubiquinone/menaquinone biosynthesis C-methylase UbiE
MGLMDTKSENDGSSADFWTGAEVERYEEMQRLMVEQKAAVLENIVRVADYFSAKRAFSSPAILDVGCGTGALFGMLLEKIPGSQVTGVDGSKEMLEAFERNCRSRFPARSALIQSDFNRLDFWRPMMGSMYDIIVSSMARHYLTDNAATRFFWMHSPD